MESCLIPSLAPLLGTQTCLAPERHFDRLSLRPQGTLKVFTLLIEATSILYPKMADLPGSQ